MTTSLLTFSLGEARFAVPADCVVATVRAVAIAALPHAPPMVEGVVNYRGVVVPVLDIRARFGLAANPLHTDQHMIVARAG
ncbi:MAG: chemotaxis protein CheW, partial [Gemmatimonadota bacterium]|nr:chemotaxis protein CheW [Gemmatimonadota bacterium]